MVTAVVSAASFMFALSVTAEITPAIEMPAQAARQVAEANIDQRADFTKSIVTKAIAKNPTIAPALVSAIAKGSPEMAVVAAVAAVIQEPKQIAAITKAAVAAAPSLAGKIVAAICKQFPAKYNLIANAAFEAAPEARTTILDAVSTTVTAAKTSVVLPPPTTGGSFTPVLGAPASKSRTDTEVVAPGGGRSYDGA